MIKKHKNKWIARFDEWFKKELGEIPTDIEKIKNDIAKIITILSDMKGKM